MFERRRDDLLEECLSRVSAGEAWPDGDLPDRVPYDEELLATVRLALEVREKFHPPGPSAEFAAASRERLLRRMRAKPKTVPVARRRQPPFNWLMRPSFALVAVLAVFLMLLSGAGTAYAARGALPGDALYGVKRGVEEVRLALSWSEGGDAALLSGYADERLAELEALLAAGGNGEALQVAVQAYAAAVERSVSAYARMAEGPATGPAEPLRGQLQRHARALEALQRAAPAGTRGALTPALRASDQAFSVLQALRQQGSPGESDPEPGKAQGVAGQPGGGRPEDAPDGRRPDRTPAPHRDPDAISPEGAGEGTPFASQGGGPPEGAGQGPPDGRGGGRPEDQGKGPSGDGPPGRKGGRGKGSPKK